MVMQAPATVTDLANLALDLIEQNQALLDVGSDQTATGKAVRRAFWQCWDEVLQAAPWNCARKRKALPQLEETPAWGFDYYYQLPADYVNMQEIDGLYEGQQWTVEETDAGAKAIAIDLDAPLYIAYTYLLRDISRASPLFRGAFVARLGAAVCAPLAKNQTIETKCWNIYNRAVLEAQGADGREGSRKPTPDSLIVSTRD
jgi:hypothetical protein